MFPLAENIQKLIKIINTRPYPKLHHSIESPNSILRQISSTVSSENKPEKFLGDHRAPSLPDFYKKIPQNSELLAVSKYVNKNAIAIGAGFKTRNSFSPEEEPVSRESNVLAPFENLLDEIGGYIGGERGETEVQIMVGTSAIAEDARYLTDEEWKWWV